MLHSFMVLIEILYNILELESSWSDFTWKGYVRYFTTKSYTSCGIIIINKTLHFRFI